MTCELNRVCLIELLASPNHYPEEVLQAVSRPASLRDWKVVEDCLDPAHFRADFRVDPEASRPYFYRWEAHCASRRHSGAD